MVSSVTLLDENGGMPRRCLSFLLLFVAGLGSVCAEPSNGPQVSLAPVGLHVSELAVIVNDADPASVETAAYYAARRGIAADHLVHVSFNPGQAVMSEDEFLQVQAQLREKLPRGVQALALAWTQPYRVACMSVTSAFAFGFDRAYCAEGCKLTRPSPYFDSDSNAPFTHLRMRPAMLLAGRNIGEVKALIDRGVRSDNSWPQGHAYLVDTRDRERNVRAVTYAMTAQRLKPAYPIEHVEADWIQGRKDAMFVFTGAATLPRLRSNRFLDGAMGDHLTSEGGMLFDGEQATVLEWLEAGATGSYGTVVEPCNFRDKFPVVPVAMSRYLSGETLVEAYWKSVRMPGQGLFVGDPMARPFGGMRLSRTEGGTLLRTRTLRPGDYELQSAPEPFGAWHAIERLTVREPGVQEVRLPEQGDNYFRLVPVR
jgi:uncharacterized protein (TIGR03790 family)